MGKILTLLIKVLGYGHEGEPWSVKVLAPDETDLYQLHDAIQSMVGFEDDHLYEFFIGRHERSRKLVFHSTDFKDASSDFFYDDDEGPDCTTPLSKIFPLEKSHKLFYNFDFGDDWLFQISCKANKPQSEPPLTEIKLIEEKGIRPIQYPNYDMDED